MDHHLGIGQRNALALGATGQQKRAHTGGHADANGGYITLDVLHGIIDCHAGRHAAAGAVDIHLDILVRILRLQIQQLGHNQTGGGIIHFFAQEDNAVVQQTGKNIIGPLAAVGLFNNIRNQAHCKIPPLRKIVKVYPPLSVI